MVRMCLVVRRGFLVLLLVSLLGCVDCFVDDF